MKKILIIGGSGFLGYHFAKYCLKKNFSVISISRKIPKKSRLIKKVKYVLADISKKKEIEKKLKNCLNVDYVINFGGEVEHKKLKKTFSSHYKGLKNILNFFFKSSLKKFIQVGSGLEYGKSKSPHNEITKVKPKSNYAYAKVRASTEVLNLSKKNFPAIIIRPYQVYGPNQDSNRVIPIAIINCLKDRHFPCSSGKQYRDFLFVDDFVNIVFKLMVDKRYNTGVFNIGFGKAYNIKKVIILIKNIIKKGNPDFGKIPLRSEENLITYPSISKLKIAFNWKPKISLLSGLRKTIKFYSKVVK